MRASTKSYSRSGTLKIQRVKVRKNASVAPALLAVCVLICICLFYVWSRIEILRINYAVTELQENLESELKLNEELTGMSAQLKSPERIARIAEKNLGLAFPKPSQVWPIGPKTDSPSAELLSKKADQGSLKVARP